MTPAGSRPHWPASSANETPTSAHPAAETVRASPTQRIESTPGRYFRNSRYFRRHVTKMSATDVVMSCSVLVHDRLAFPSRSVDTVKACNCTTPSPVRPASVLLRLISRVAICPARC